MNKPTTTELLNWAEGCKVKNALDCLLIVRSLIEKYGDGGGPKISEEWIAETIYQIHLTYSVTGARNTLRSELKKLGLQVEE